MASKAYCLETEKANLLFSTVGLLAAQLFLLGNLTSHSIQSTGKVEKERRKLVTNQLN
jgi:hypothetical protein